MPCHSVKVKSVHGLAVLLHHVVGNVYQIVDGTDAAGPEPLLHPLWGRRNLYVGADPCTISGAQVRILYFHGNVIVNIFLIFLHFHHWRHERFTEGSCCFPCNAQNTITVYPVGSDLILKYRVPHAQDLNRVGAHLHILPENVDPHLRSFRIHISVGAKFLYGTHHPI